jgi:hypothetical protein
MSEVLELLEAAEAKAMYGLAINWKPLQALTEALLDRGVLQVGPIAYVYCWCGDPYGSCCVAGIIVAVLLVLLQF